MSAGAGPGVDGQGRSWSLRSILVTSLLLLSIVPALTVGWFLYRGNLRNVHTLSEKIAGDVA